MTGQPAIPRFSDGDHGAKSLPLAPAPTTRQCLSYRGVVCLTLLLTLSALPTIAQAQMGGQKAPPPQVLTGSAKTPAPFETTAIQIEAFLEGRSRDSRGQVDYPTLFNALGALSGFGCQIAIREGLVKTGKVPPDKAFVVVETKDGIKFYFGNLLNGCLLGGAGQQISVWSLVGGAAQAAGAKDLPNLQDIAAYNSKTVGTRDFGVPRIPDRYRAQEAPLDSLRKLWPVMQKLLTDNHVDPTFWGWTFALSGQHLILKSKDVLDPGTAAKIMMEAVLPMSKVDPAAVADSFK